MKMKDPKKWFEVKHRSSKYIFDLFTPLRDRVRRYQGHKHRQRTDTYAPLEEKRTVFNGIHNVFAASTTNLGQNTAIYLQKKCNPPTKADLLLVPLERHALLHLAVPVDFDDCWCVNSIVLLLRLLVPRSQLPSLWTSTLSPLSGRLQRTPLHSCHVWWSFLNMLLYICILFASIFSTWHPHVCRFRRPKKCQQRRAGAQWLWSESADGDGQLAWGSAPSSAGMPKFIRSNMWNRFWANGHDKEQNTWGYSKLYLL